jgi:hypothetical protein
MRYFKGIIKQAFLQRLLNSRDYLEHANNGGTYTLVMKQNTFEIIPVSVKYYHVFLVR